MKLKILLLSALFTVSFQVHALSCSGNACDVVDVKWVNMGDNSYCYRATNNGYKTVTVEFPPHVKLTLKPGESDYPKILNACLQGYTSPLKANYK